MYNKEMADAIVEGLKNKNGSVVSCAWAQQVNPSVDMFFEKYFFDMVAYDPQALTGLGIFELLGVRGHNAYLTPISVAEKERLIACVRTNLQLLQTYDYAQLTDEQKITYKFVKWELEHILQGEPFLAHAYCVTQMFGAIFDLSYVLTQQHTIMYPEDVAHYKARLHAIPEQLQQVQEFIQVQKSKGIVVPAFALQKVVSIIQKSLPENVEQHGFYQYLQKHPALVDDELLQHVAIILKEKVYPAYHALALFCNVLLGELVGNHGVWALPHGDAYYAYILHHHTTTDLTPDQVHSLGLSEVQKIQNEMRGLLAQEGIVDGAQSVAQLMHTIENATQFYYPETAEGRAQCLADFDAILKRCRKELYPLFDVKPKAPVQVMVVPDHESEGAPGAYYSPANADGSRPGKFFVNMRNMKELPKYDMETLAVHEAEPGHHFQISVQQEAALPLVRKFLKSDFYNAYVEGWALYTEKLAYEQGFYSSNWSKIGHLKAELMRAVRLVVDTGIHSKRWTREQAIEYMERELGMHHDSVVSEVERYFVLPGQACSYKIGQLKILELRKKMQDALGSTFDIREFHNVVLKLGAAPLTVLEEVIDQYVQENTLT